MPAASIIDRMEEATQRVQDRLRRATAALREAGVPHCVVGGNAVAAWVAQADAGAVRNTRDVDIMVRRSDWPRVQAVMAAAGFTYRHARMVDMFLDGPDAKARDAVHVLFAGERVTVDQLVPNPELEESTDLAGLSVLGLEALVRVKLCVWRDKDRTHLRDFIDVGLVDATWPPRFIPPLAERLRFLLGNPEDFVA